MEETDRRESIVKEEEGLGYGRAQEKTEWRDKAFTTCGKMGLKNLLTLSSDSLSLE